MNFVHFFVTFPRPKVGVACEWMASARRNGILQFSQASQPTLCGPRSIAKLLRVHLQRQRRAAPWIRLPSAFFQRSMKIAIEGCCHGELDNIYASISKAEQQGNFKTDLLLLCGDMQALRNRADLECLAVPQKYRQMGDFHRYYSGEKVAPVLTLVVGGNHEASNYMFELFHGGWLAPNIYFLGEAGVVDVDVGGGEGSETLRIAGASGIYKSHDYHLGRFERMPLRNRELKSVYHTRKFDIWRLKLLAASETRPDIVMSHDWPNTIEQHGDTAALIKRKPFFQKEIEEGWLGSPPLMELLKELQPKYWFSAHLHVKFAALFKHGQPSKLTTSHNPEALDIDIDDDVDDVTVSTKHNPDEINIQDDSDVEDEDPPGCDHKHSADTHTHAVPSATTSPSQDAGSNKTTRFLALSKCLPNHDFLQFIDYPIESTTPNKPPTLRFVPRWLAILRATNDLLSLSHDQAPLPPTTDETLQARIAHEEQWVKDNLLNDETADGHHPLDIQRIQQFTPTAAPTNTPMGKQHHLPLQWFTNPQTEALSNWLQIENKINRPDQPPPPPPPVPQQQQQQGYPPSNQPMPPVMRFAPPPSFDARATEEEEIRQIEAAAQRATDARKRTKRDHVPAADVSEPLRLEDDDELNARWKEGTG